MYLFLFGAKSVWRSGIFSWKRKGRRAVGFIFALLMNTIMWKGYLALFLLLPLWGQASDRKGRTAADDILGSYMIYAHRSQETVHLNFYKADNGDYEARIVWMEQPTDDLGKPRTDVNNPRAAYRHIPLSHLVIVRGLRYDAKNGQWENGRIYDPSTGKTYRCFIRFEDDARTLRVKCYVGFRFLGRSLYWSRIV